MAKETLILTGFMGMGKSTVGPLSAEVIGVDYFDTDDWMETESGIDVPNLVKTNMSEFRKVEAMTLGTILDRRVGVISTGGGIVSTEVGRAALLGSNVPVVWLKAPFDVAVERVANDPGRERPLFSDTDSAKRLFEERQAWYEETATHSVDASLPTELVVNEVVSILRPQ